MGTEEVLVREASASAEISSTARLVRVGDLRVLAALLRGFLTSVSTTVVFVSFAILFYLSYQYFCKDTKNNWNNQNFSVKKM
jgi:hypothetical protein